MNEKVTDLVKSGPVCVSSETWCLFSKENSIQDVPILTAIPRAPAGPEGPIGPCAPCERASENEVSEHEATPPHLPRGPEDPDPGATSRCSKQEKAITEHTPTTWSLSSSPNSGYSQPLLYLLVCQLGQQGQESLGAQELQGHPMAQSHHDHPIGARYQIQPRTFQKRQAEILCFPEWCVRPSTVPPNPHPRIDTSHSP